VERSSNILEVTEATFPSCSEGNLCELAEGQSGRGEVGLWAEEGLALPKQGSANQLSRSIIEFELMQGRE
jgi:hypothetical protein